MNERHPPVTPAQPALIALPAFADNYIWLLHDGQAAWVVDPGDAQPVIQALQERQLHLRGILVTHHHADHVAGIAALRPYLQGQVWGPARERIPQPCVPLREGDTVEVLGWPFAVLEVPGHTAGHIAYVQQARPDGEAGNLQAPLLFCGDTLFSAGCGRLFEGTPAQMLQSLARLAALPAATRVCCTHEYTLSNLKFAATVEPGNADVLHHLRHCQALREQGLPTLPSSIGLERRINPFLRCSQPAAAASARQQAAQSGAPLPEAHDAVAVLASLRAWKNEFR